MAHLVPIPRINHALQNTPQVPALQSTHGQERFDKLIVPRRSCRTSPTRRRPRTSDNAPSTSLTLWFESKVRSSWALDLRDDIARERTAVRVLVLTTYDEDDYVFGALGAGASGFLLKNVHTAELHRAIRAVAAGDAVLTPRVTRQVLERGVPRSLPARQREHARRMVGALTPHELDIVRLIADGLSNAEITRRLVLEPASVRRNTSRILAKPGLRDRVRIAVAWHRAGL